MTRVKDEKDLVVPGDVILEGEEVRPGHGTYEKEDKIHSKYLGVVEYRNSKVKVVPMGGRYIPREGDLVIGEVSQVGYSSWMVDMDSPYEGRMKIDTAVDEYIDLDEDELTDYYDVGEAIVVKVSSVTEGYDVNLSMEDRRCRKLRGGRITKVAPSKVPRVIGKKGTMIKQIKDKTGCRMIVGQNGLVWVKGDNENLAVRAVRKVEEEAHTEGLTEEIGDWLDEELVEVNE